MRFIIPPANDNAERLINKYFADAIILTAFSGSPPLTIFTFRKEAIKTWPGAIGYVPQDVMVSDEATSSLDGETEANITEAIQSMNGLVTVVMSAYRLSTVRESDIIVYMSAGKIIKIGTFKEVRDVVLDFEHQAQLMEL